MGREELDALAEEIAERLGVDPETVMTEPPSRLSLTIKQVRGIMAPAPDSGPAPVRTKDELDEASNYFNGVPSEERKQQDIAFLVNTNIPYDYRAALERLNLDHQLVKTNRPSRLAMDHSYTSGRVVGFEQAVKGLFGYFFDQTATEVLKAAVSMINEQRGTAT